MTSYIPKNKNLQSANKFQLVISKFPNMEFFVQRLPVPGLNLGTTYVSTNKEIDLQYPGDKITYEDLLLSFILDEDIVAYEEVYNWICDVAISGDKSEQFSDMSIIILTNNSNSNKTITFYNAFPYNVTGFSLDVAQSEANHNTVDVMFKYSHYDIKTTNAKTAGV